MQDGEFSVLYTKEIKMGKNIIQLFILVMCLSLSAELDYNLESEFGFGGIGNLKYSNGKIFSADSYGYAIYGIQENGDLENTSNVRYEPWMNHYYSHDRLGAYSGYVSFKNNEDFGSYFTIYDTSVPNQQTILYETQIDINNMFAAELFENYFIRRTGVNQHTVFDYERFEPISQIDDITLVYPSKFNDMGAILLDFSDNCYYYYIIDETGTLQKKYNLGQEERKIAIFGDKMISYSLGDIRLYNITASDSLEYTGTTYFNGGIMRSVVFENNKIIFTSEEGGGGTSILLLKMLVLDEENNLILIDTKQLAERPSLTGVPGSSLILNNNSLYISVHNIKFTQANITNNAIEMLDVNYIERGRSSLHGFIKNNKFYTMCFEINTNLHSYSLENCTNVQQIDNVFPEKSAYWYFQEEEKIVRFDEILECFYFYDWEDDNLILTDSYDLEGFVDTSFLTPFKWDGNQFIYRIDSSLISVIMENGELTESWVLDGSLTYNYEVYQNYIYQLRPNQGIKVYSFNESEYQLVNNITTPFVSYFPAIFIRGDILTANNKNIIDLSYDPVGLSMRYDLNQYYVNSGAVKYYDYLIYCGTANYDTPYGYDYSGRLLSIFKLIDNVPVEVGVITSEYSFHNFLIIEGGTEDNFDLLVSNNNFFSIYTCHATPNGDLEITPVTLNATNYPNPFNPETTISYDVSQKGSVTVDIYNIKGQKVKSLVSENQEAGKHSIIWQGDNDQGKQISSGTYFYKIKSAGQEVVKKMLLMK